MVSQAVIDPRKVAPASTQYQFGGSGCSSCGGGGDQLAALVDPNGNQTSWTYDAQGRIAQETRADGSSESYTYETTSSRLKQKTDRKGVTTTFSYFLDGKLASKTYSDATPAVSYTYDPVDGQMLTAANGTDTLTWTYDDLDRVATEASTKNSSTVGYSYDDAGNRTALTLNGTGYLTYGYDQLSRLTGITYGTQSFGFGYDTASRRTSMTYPNGVVTIYGFDGESRLTSIAANRGSTPITSFSYVLDAVGNRTLKTTLDWSEAYGYDSAYRLVSADRSSGSPSRWRFAYDAVGNRTADQTDDASNGAAFNSLNQLLSRAPGGALAFRGTTNEAAAVTVAGQPAQTTSDNTFSAQAPVLTGTTDVAVTATDPSGNARTNTYRVSTSGAGTTYSYDPNGNLTTKTEGSDNWVYTWNAEDQLTSVLLNGIEQARFGYDALGRRVEKVSGGVTTNYVYDGGHVTEERPGTGRIRYTHGSDVDDWLSRENADGSVTFFVSDALGSIVAETNGAGAVTLVRAYDPWGNLDATTSTVVGPSFTGRWWEPNVRLYDYRARWYDPKIGRFISEDPVAERARDVLAILGSSHGVISGGKVQPYSYAGDDPVNATDPSGMTSRSNRDCGPRSPNCSDYPRCYSYFGTNASCFCRCAGNDPWSRHVRCCLFDKYDAGWGGDAAHYYCYAEAWYEHGVRRRETAWRTVWSSASSISGTPAGALARALADEVQGRRGAHCVRSCSGWLWMPAAPRRSAEPHEADGLERYGRQL